jgi:ATP-dependent Lon protease
MFPLGTVLLPGMLVPLHVFEPRYRQMVDDCRAGDGTFGVVLIERGSEVGGGDVRTDVGTLTRIVETRELPDGRWLLGVVGVERLRVTRWLDDDPYPRAEVEPWLDTLDGSEPATRAGLATDDDVAAEDAAAERDGALRLLRQASALGAELGRAAAPLELELPDDPVMASYVAVAVSPLGPADRQRLLTAPSVDDRWATLAEMLADQVELLQAQLAGPDDPDR